MQENNNFVTIVQAWQKRANWTPPNNRLSMSGDSSDGKSFEMKEHESERGVAAPTAAVATSAPPLPDTLGTDENTNIIYQYDDKDNDEGAGSAKVEDEYYENGTDYEPSYQGSNNSLKSNEEELDGVHLNRSSSCKTRSGASSDDEDDCASKCTYFTMQCCECSVM